MQLPNTSATHPPASHTPENACDAHLHIYDSSLPSAGSSPKNADANSYKKIQRLLATRRAVVVQPRVYGTDNTATLNAIRQLGANNTRGIAVISKDIDEKTLERLHQGGIRGVRFSFHEPNACAGGFDAIEHIAQKIAPLGWHIQLHWTAGQIVEHKGLLQRLHTTIVFDHMARLPGNPENSPSFSIVANLVESGNTWVKLSGAYLNTHTGAKGNYSDTDPIAKALIAIAPERLVWGSDWPHVTEPDNKPDDAELLDLLHRWCSNEPLRHQILVQNPARLYGFES